MKRIGLFLPALLYALVCFGQAGSLKGYIKDYENGAPLTGVTVHLDEKGAISDQLGYFFIPGLNPGAYEVQLSYVGYATEVVKVEVPENKTVEVDVKIRRSTLSLRDVVVSGKGNLQSTSLSAVDVQLRPVNSSQDILKMVPGLFIAQHAGGGKAEQIFLRGFDLDHGTDINISVDGMPVNMVSHAHGQGYADLHFLEPELVETVNFEKGPYNTRYGNFATSAFVAFSTPDFLKDQYAKIEVGSFNTKRLATAVTLYNRETNKIRDQWYASGAYGLTDGYFDNPQHFKRGNFFTKYTAAYTDKTLLSISVSSFTSKWDASGQIPQRAVDQGLITRFGSIDSSEGGNTSRTNVNVLLQHRLTDHLSLSNRVYYSHYRFSLFSNFTFFLENPVNGDEIQQKENRDLYGWSGSVAYNGSLGGKTYKAAWGYGFRHDNLSGISLNNAVNRVITGTVQSGAVRETNLYTYLDQTIDLGRQLQLNAGLRYDWLNFSYLNKLQDPQHFRSQNRGIFSPKLNLFYTASKNIKLYASSGVGFHSNDTRVILDATANKILPKVYGLDAGLITKPFRGLLVKATAWWMYSEQEFVYVGDAGVVEPSGETRRYGIDLAVRYQLNKWLFADVDLNWTKARAVGAPKAENYVPLAAPFTSIGGLTAKSKKGFSGSLRYRNISSRPANEDNSVVASGYFLVDALLGYRWKAVDFSFTIQNLLNTQWKEAQFDTFSRLKNEVQPVSEIHFTAGAPMFVKGGITVHF